MKLAAIIVAAGSSRRMGFDKLLAPISGKPVLQRTIEVFAECPHVREMIVVCPEPRFETLDLEFSHRIIKRVDGGQDRHDSVSAGLNALSEDADYVAVHDGARPLVSCAQIGRVFQAACQYSAATSARPVTETVKRADSQGRVTESVAREGLWLMETPQIFRTDLLLDAYHLVQHNGERVTDEVSAMQLIGHHTYLVDNPGPNPKITYPQDIDLAEKLLTSP